MNMLHEYNTKRHRFQPQRGRCSIFLSPSLYQLFNNTTVNPCPKSWPQRHREWNKNPQKQSQLKPPRNPHQLMLNQWRIENTGRSTYPFAIGMQTTSIPGKILDRLQVGLKPLWITVPGGRSESANWDEGFGGHGMCWFEGSRIWRR